MGMERISSCTPWNQKIYDPVFFKTIFFCSAPIWVPFLEELNKDKRFEITWVVCWEDKSVWRWMNLQENIIKKTAKQLWIQQIKTPNKINLKTDEWKQFHEWLQKEKPDFIVVIAYWKIIPQSILNIPSKWAINIHWSILPCYRWASPIQSIFLNNEKESWITIMHMDKKMDEWDIIKILKFKIPFEWTAKELIEKLKKVWPKFTNNTVWDYGKWLLWREKQDMNKATYCYKMWKNDWEINIYKDSLDIIYKKYRAFYLWPKIRFVLKNWKRVIIENLKLDENIFEKTKNNPLIKDNNLNEAVIKMELKPEWKKTIDWQEFKKWYEI